MHFFLYNNYNSYSYDCTTISILMKKISSGGYLFNVMRNGQTDQSNDASPNSITIVVNRCIGFNKIRKSLLTIYRNSNNKDKIKY